MLRINEVKLNVVADRDDIASKTAKILNVKKSDIKTLKLLKRSIDAREKMRSSKNKELIFSYNVVVGLTSNNMEEEILSKNIKGVLRYDPKIFEPKLNIDKEKMKDIRPIIVGFGPAGLFAAYIFTMNGIKPIIYERGNSIEDRVKDVMDFLRGGDLKVNSNISFGEGGAGTFSDGKLYTNNKDKDGMGRFILETFVKYGASDTILYDAHPHIGTDKLRNIIISMRNDIVKLGAEIHFNTKIKFSDNDYDIDDKNENIKTINIKDIRDNNPVLIAVGNSARDTYRELVDSKFDLKSKTFAMGFRIAVPQTVIDNSQYGKITDKEKKVLGPAIFKLVDHISDDRSMYTFCMCPGGYIVNSSSYKNMLSINGMSYNDRKARYANTAIIENILIEDNDDPLCGVKIQEEIERKAYEMGKGKIPAALYKDALNGNKDLLEKTMDILPYPEEVFKGKVSYVPEIINIYDDLKLPYSIKEDFINAMEKFNEIIKGLISDDTVIAGVETRTSSTVSLERDENYMCNVEGFYPCGEGLGHGGGIISAAIDGIKVATAILSKS